MTGRWWGSVVVFFFRRKAMMPPGWVGVFWFFVAYNCLYKCPFLKGKRICSWRHECGANAILSIFWRVGGEGGKWRKANELRESSHRFGDIKQTCWRERVSCLASSGHVRTPAMSIMYLVNGTVWVSIITISWTKSGEPIGDDWNFLLQSYQINGVFPIFLSTRKHCGPIQSCSCQYEPSLN